MLRVCVGVGSLCGCWEFVWVLVSCVGVEFVWVLVVCVGVGLWGC